jgi:endonuclease III
MPRGGHVDVRSWRARVRRVASRLSVEYGDPRHGNVRNATDELFYILLSNRTDPRRYPATFRELRRRYSPWRLLLAATADDLETLLRPLGLERTRAARLTAIARRLQQDFGAVSLNRLRRWPLDEARSYLLSLPGVGEKTARCVLMYSFGHDVSPVDTHQLRVLLRLGLLPAATTAGLAHRLLDDWLPVGLARQLHVNLVAHGRSVCTPRSPRCEACCLRLVCARTTGMQLFEGENATWH